MLYSVSTGKKYIGALCLLLERGLHSLKSSKEMNLRIQYQVFSFKLFAIVNKKKRNLKKRKKKEEKGYYLFSVLFLVVVHNESSTQFIRTGESGVGIPYFTPASSMLLDSPPCSLYSRTLIIMEKSH